MLPLQLGQSRIAATLAIAQVVLSRIGMAASTMGEFVTVVNRESDYGRDDSVTVLVPIVMKVIEKRRWFMVRISFLPCYLDLKSEDSRSPFQKRTWLSAPIQTIIAGFTLTFTTPLCCAFTEQNAAIKALSYFCFQSHPTLVFSSRKITVAEENQSVRSGEAPGA